MNLLFYNYEVDKINLRYRGLLVNDIDKLLTRELNKR